MDTSHRRKLRFELRFARVFDDFSFLYALCVTCVFLLRCLRRGVRVYKSIESLPIVKGTPSSSFIPGLEILEEAE